MRFKSPKFVLILFIFCGNLFCQGVFTNWKNVFFADFEADGENHKNSKELIWWQIKNKGNFGFADIQYREGANTCSLTSGYNRWVAGLKIRNDHQKPYSIIVCPIHLKKINFSVRGFSVAVKGVSRDDSISLGVGINERITNINLGSLNYIGWRRLFANLDEPVSNVTIIELCFKSTGMGKNEFDYYYFDEITLNADISDANFR